MIKTISIAFAFLLLCPAAHAGDWPQVGDKFRRTDGTVMTVAKIKTRDDVDQSRVCLRQAPAGACVWSKVGDLKGDWVTYGGEPQLTR
ncbi:hypothetical protein [Bradyrhizobium sp. th.b2]|uniref:hypothetical protein n=1 Tax=Bradyrhizobium sp. th-b2 TaxID=172088 RepID=UPI00040DC825|nr:hypothetical protein [Bradyrhizobium sp. th.b2]